MNRKTIALPGRPDVDITDIQPLIDSRIFQKLRYRAQLGVSSLIFPDANHTRFSHSLGSYDLTRERTRIWLHCHNSIGEQQAINANIASLLHDIGHGPLSHTTEPLCAKDHKAHGLELLSGLGKAIQDSGAEPHNVKALLSHADPLHCCFSHRPLGTEKLDYLIGDARHTTEAISPRIGDLINHVYYRNGQLVVDVKIMPEVCRLLEDYAYAHERVYLRKSAVISQAFLRQIVFREMAGSGSPLTPVNLADMLDFELFALLANSSLPNVAPLFDRLLYREWPKMAIRLLPERVIATDRLTRKAITTFRLSDEHLAMFHRYRHPQLAAGLESAIAQCADIPPAAVLIVVPVASPERFMPEDILICDGSDHMGSWTEAAPAYYQGLRETLRRYSAIRICTFSEYRQHLATPKMAQAIFELLIAHANNAA